MINEAFEKLKYRNLVDWGVILLGLTDLPNMTEHLHPVIVSDFATTELAKVGSEDPLFEDIAAIAMSAEDDSSELFERIRKICKTKQVNIEHSKRKWRLVLLEYTIETLDSDPIYGLIKLAEFWTTWNWPDNTPACMKNTDKEMSTEEYHSQSHYDYVIQEHKEWMVIENNLVQKLS